MIDFKKLERASSEKTGFYFFAGRALEEGGMSPRDRSLAGDLPDRKGSPRVLVIDDNRDAADSFALLLETMGAASHAVYDGLSGVAAMHQLKPEIVFVDIGMPSLDGYETARLILQGGHAHRFILVALTGWSRDEDRRRAKQAGFDVHLVKPARIDAIEALLRLAKRAEDVA